MKHAYLIIAHSNFDVLESSLSMLDYKDNDIYVHIDRKVEYSIKYKCKYSNLYLIPEDKRIDVRWADVTIIYAELALYRMAFDNGKYDYFHLMSGMDLPIKSQKYIHEFFELNKGKEFIGLMQNAWRTKTKVMYYHILMKKQRGTSLCIKCCQHMHWIFTQFQKCLPVVRSKNNMPTLYKGCTWCSLSHDAVEYLLSYETWIKKRFRWTFGADEIYKHTLLFNSDFKNKVYSTKGEYEACLRLQDWKRGNPYVWTMADYDEIMQSKMLFARKFSSKNIDLVNAIYNKLKNEK